MSKTFKFALVPGWAENRWKTHEFLDGLIMAGGVRITQLETADLIISHSAGGHTIPANIKPRLLVIIAPTYLPNSSFFAATAKEYLMDTLLYLRRLLILPWVQKNLYYIFFGITHPKRTVRTIKELRKPLDLAGFKKIKVLLVRNDKDFFCSIKIKELINKYPNARLIELPGRHDDVWINPQPYVDLIIKEYN